MKDFPLAVGESPLSGINLYLAGEDYIETIELCGILKINDN